MTTTTHHVCSVVFLRGDTTGGSEYTYRIPTALRREIVADTWVLVPGHGDTAAVPRIARVVSVSRAALASDWRTRWLLGAACPARHARELSHP